MRLYRELCRCLREVRRSLRDERRRRKKTDAIFASRAGAPERTASRSEHSDVEDAMSGAFAESAGMPKAATIREVMVETDRQTGDAIKELESVERELREAGYMPSGVASK